MDESKVIALERPGEDEQDVLTEVLRQGAWRMLAQTVEAEVEAFVAAHEHIRDEAGRRLVVRNGYLPERTIQCGIGDIAVKAPRVRDRSGSGIRFTSAILPPYLRRTKSIEELIPWLYLKGISTGDFSEALAALLGPDAPGLSATTVSRLKAVWQGELEAWQGRDLTGKRYVYFWVDGVYFQARLEQARQCFLVIIGADEAGNKELVGLWDGFRESEQSWSELLLDLKSRGLEMGPKLAVGDGALGFWTALRKIHSETRQQRCWVHKTANVLNKLPKSLQKQAKQRLHEIWMAEGKDDSEKAFDLFVDSYQAKYPKAAECLAKDRDVLLAFYDFPAEHWVHIRTTNPIESTFATVRLRTAKTRGCLSRETASTMVFKLTLCAQRKWRRLNGSNWLTNVIEGVKFEDGIKVDKIAA
ncbi:MAG: IS256 family transposase [SAR324 cluster bacterium]|nr:IS256 family transposase [SAR324 cluster bacterium]